MNVINYIEILESWDDIKLKIWIENIFHFSSFRPLPIHVSIYPNNDFIALVDEIEEEDKYRGKIIKERVRYQISELIKTSDSIFYSNNQDDFKKKIDVFANLLLIVEDLRIHSLVEDLYHKIEVGLYKNYYSSKNEEIHQFIIRTAFSFPIYNIKRILNISENLLLEKDYAIFGYKKLWKIDTKNGINYLPLLFNTLCIDSKYIQLLHEIVGEFIEINESTIRFYMHKELNKLDFVTKLDNCQSEFLTFLQNFNFVFVNSSFVESAFQIKIDVKKTPNHKMISNDKVALYFENVRAKETCIQGSQKIALQCLNEIKK